LTRNTELISDPVPDSNHSSSSESLASTLGSTTKSTASDALASLMSQINQTKEKMVKTEDLDEQIKCAELLSKLTTAAMALKELEEAT